MKDVALDDVDIKPVWDALADDFNTPQAIAMMFEWRRLAEKEVDPAVKLRYLMQIKRSGYILGLFQNQDRPEVDEAWITSLIAKRQEAKEQGNYALSDSIRDELLKAGIRLEDTKDGVKWHQI